MKRLTRLIYADSESCADLFYATRFFAPDPFLFVQSPAGSAVVVNDLEYDRARREAQVDAVESWTQWTGQARENLGNQPTEAEVIARYLQSRRVRRVLVPRDFPLGLARELEVLGFALEIASGAFWPERELKSSCELDALNQALRATEKGLRRALAILRNVQIGRGRVLRWQRKVLTSELLRAEIEAEVLRAGAIPNNTIVAGGDQACDPHERGSGPLRAEEFIIVDIFPRHLKTGYFGDMTRTFLVGEASVVQVALWKAVARAQKMALEAIAPGRSGKKIHQQLVDFLAQSGFSTEVREGRRVGFFHGTGHGLGLEVHESPRFAATHFREGQVLTVEPGLYYPGLGGVRIEDVGVVTKKGFRLLSHFPKVWHIR